MRVSVENYKSIYNKMSININGMTIIAGSNSSGKSSFMQPFMILKQTVENNSDGESLIINGENASLTEGHQLFCKKNSNNNSFSIFIEKIHPKKKTNEVSKIKFGYSKKDGFTAIESSNNDFVIKSGMSKSEINELINKLKEKDEVFKNIFDKISPDTPLIPQLKSKRSFLSIEFSPKSKSEVQQHVFSFGISPTGNIEEFVGKLIHIPGIRSNPERQYKIERYNKRFQGRFDKYTASIIYNWGLKERKKLETLISLISELGLASNIKAQKVNEAHISLNISRYFGAEENDVVDLSDVGFGLSQILPILIAIIEANQDNIIYIEQPEIHLHPLAQYKLASILCRYVKKGKKLVIETHSSIFIRGLQTEIVKGNISNKEVSLNWFSQDSSGETKVYESAVDEIGAFGDWPSDFDDTYLKADSEYLDAVEEKLI
ncbi:AAA family ATPase [Acinetobacter sp. IRS14]|uniref:AAA family ATPase n=1 Tax=Acinetobacter sp. IRS14 TaxID=2983398 RepID=UPI002AFE29FA|nr:AAA family ATPase [Acinetobacter sp. IRS14]MEA1229339.1 AAA family ATPase [Acinetobacter sp. IRS14]